MDWDLAIEKNRVALMRVLAMLVAMAGCLASPLAGFEARSSGRASGSTVGREGRGDCEAIGVPGNVREAEAPAGPGEGVFPPTLPRHLHRAILRLLRAAESAARRLVIVMARGVRLAPPRQRAARPRPAVLRNGFGTGILVPPGARPVLRPRPGTLSLPLLDPLRPFRARRPVATGVPRISVPGVTAPSPITRRQPPAPDDPIDATRLALRLGALGAALDDLPGQARRFARWRGLKQAGRTRRAWPLRPGRAPGQRPAGRRRHAVYDILTDLQGLALEALAHPDTS